MQVTLIYILLINHLCLLFVSVASPYRQANCIYTFVAGQGKRVKLDFEQFQLAGTSENCEAEYVDIYSELERPDENLLFASLGGRYCGSVSPHVRISLYNILVLVFHSRVGHSSVPKLRFKGNFSFIPEDPYIPGEPFPPNAKCSFLIDSRTRKRGNIFSPAYPGTYPKNFHCSYMLRGQKGQRIRMMFQDFDIYFGGEHCPYDSVTIFDGSNTSAPIIRKVCGLQQRLEQFSVGPELLVHFNTTDPPKADPRGFIIEYEFSNRFVDVTSLLGGEHGVTHMRGTECDVRVESNRETTHYIQSPRFPDMYPSNTTCTYILDGLQGDQNLEKVILNFEVFAIISDSDGHAVSPLAHHDFNPEEITCPNAYVGVAIQDQNMKATLSSTDESNFDVTLCDRLEKSGPHVSEGPRMVIQFGTTDKIISDGKKPLGFRARVDFKTDFGIPGEPVGDSNVCAFRFRAKMESFNSPRYPANYPLDTNCTYDIIGGKGEHILIHFEQFALDPEDKECRDWLEIYDIFEDEGRNETTRLQARYCSTTFPGPRVSSFGAHKMRVVFSSDASGTGNGFKALYEIRPAPREDVPSAEGALRDPKHCGKQIFSSASETTGWIISPGYPNKYNKDVHCDWLITARQGYEILLTLVKMEIEGEIKADGNNCQKAVIRVTSDGRDDTEFCGTDQSIFKAIITKNGTVRVSFLTAPDKVNGLVGFNFSWTEARRVEGQGECHPDTEYLCTYSKVCIAARLRCDGDENCGDGDDTDEIHCGMQESGTDATIIFACVVSAAIFLFILFFFCYLFKNKLQRKKRRNRRRDKAAASSLIAPTRGRARQPYRGPAAHKPHGKEPEIVVMADDNAACRIVHHDLGGVMPPVKLKTIQQTHTFYG